MFLKNTSGQPLVLGILKILLLSFARKVKLRTYAMYCLKVFKKPIQDLTLSFHPSTHLTSGRLGEVRRKQYGVSSSPPAKPNPGQWPTGGHVELNSFMEAVAEASDVNANLTSGYKALIPELN